METVERVREQVRHWRDELISLSRRDRVLYYRPTSAASLLIEHPEVETVLTVLARTNGSWSIYLPPVVEEVDDAEDPTPDPLEVLPPKPTELVSHKRDPKKVENALRTLERRTTQEFMDKGIWVLYMAAGFLHWVDPDNDGEVRSPLLLIPVNLVRPSPRDPFRVVMADEEPVVNPALVVKMESDFGIELPVLDDPDEVDVTAYLTRVKRLIRDRPWSVSRNMALDVFSFYKEVMYKDLKDNEDAICDNELVQALALGSTAEARLAFTPPSEADLDTLHPPEDMATILDSDGSQRRCVVVASQGNSFVMDGPPGTGKSQTIANIISQCIYDGRTVLFVSEKIAALEVVKARLDDAGLGEYLLELHSHKTSRRDVAKALFESLRRYPKPTRQLGAASLEKLRSIRRELSAYAEAVNEVRAPLGRSLHTVIGRVSQLDRYPRVTVPADIDASLDVATLQEILTVGEALSRAWSPVAMGEAFLWRGVTPDLVAMGAKRRAVETIDEALDALTSFESKANQVAGALELWWNDAPRSATELVRVLYRLQSRQQVPTHWLTVDSLDEVSTRIEELRQLTAEREQTVQRLMSSIGPSWESIDPAASSRVADALASLASVNSSWVINDQMDMTDLAELSRFFSGSDTDVKEIESLAGRLADGLGIDCEPLTLARVDQLIALTDLIGASHRPESDWLDPLALLRLEEATTVLGALVDSYREKAESLATTFNSSVLDLDLETLHARFTTLHRGIRKLGGAYRADKKLLARATRIGKVTAETIAALPAAMEWQRMSAELSAAESRHAGLLGGYYYQGPSTDFDAIADAIDVARRAVELAGHQLADASRFRAQLGRDGHPDSRLRMLSGELKTVRDRLTAAATLVLGDESVAFSMWPLEQLLEWLGTCAPHIRALAAEGKRAEVQVSRRIRVDELKAILADRSTVFELEEILSAGREGDRALLGSGYEAVSTDWSVLMAGLEWAHELRSDVGAPIEEATADRLLATEIEPDDLSATEKTWHLARDRVVSYFDLDRAEMLVTDMEASFLDARELLEGLRDSVGLVDDWVAFSECRNQLASLGVAATTEGLIAGGVDSSDVVPALERAVLEAWTDSVLATDSRLKNLRSEDRDALVSDFRHLDQRLVESSAGKVMEAANARRPLTNLGAAGLLEREGQKKRRHMPVRDLISRTSEVVQAIKPCFMMSPLSVSQFLTPELHFDLVIFDEASQVKPADAVNCVYRGAQLVVAGDQKQLPPTTFFETVSLDAGDEYEEDQIDEFESVLDLAKAGGMESLPLRWHYRSQHESLITYSNYSFYDGHLITFPSAMATAPDVGLEFFYVEGQYRRGGARDNPIEAGVVAERVLFHAARHPHLTLGVVAFSEAQASTIQYVLEERRRDSPELDGFFDEDRLTGFFVKNLENVQGDERDIMIFSVGYGPDEMGRVTMNFGPLNQKRGERRLNVAITRARRRVEVVSSLRPSDFQPTASAGPRHLGRYLDFLDRGMAAVALQISDESRDTESPFEDEVVRLLSEWGFNVHPQVGVAEYRIDVAIADPARPGTYLLGIECDGAMYHSSQVARDRDRLRQQVLERLGWRIHRIWGPAWYRDRRGEESRLREAIEAAIAEETDTPRPRRSLSRSRSVEFVEIDLEATPTWAQEYTVSHPRAASWLDMHDPAALPILTEAVEQVVNVEGPVHKEVALRRVRTAWGVGRAGNRIREAFYQAIANAERRQTIRSDRYHFLWATAEHELIVRHPSAHPDSLRRVSEVAREELDLATVNLARDARQITWDDLTAGVARLLGWGRRGAEIDRALDDAIRRLINLNKLVRDRDYLMVPSAEGTIDGITT